VELDCRGGREAQLDRQYDSTTTKGRPVPVIKRLRERGGDYADGESKSWLRKKGTNSLIHRLTVSEVQLGKEVMIPDMSGLSFPRCCDLVEGWIEFAVVSIKYLAK
jgi:hypothetical protein